MKTALQLHQEFRVDCHHESSGRRGIEILSWENDQPVLEQMTEVFLVQNKNGERFWPSESSKPYWNGTVYTEMGVSKRKSYVNDSHIS